VARNSHKANIDYTYANNSLNHRSIIDHFIVSGNIFDLFQDSRVHYDVTNPSNHNAVKFDFKCNVNNIVTRDNANGLSTDRCAWHKATQGNIDVYKNNLDLLLAKIYIPTHALCVMTYYVRFLLTSRILINYVAIFN